MRLLIPLLLVLTLRGGPASVSGTTSAHHLLPNGSDLAFSFGTGGALMLAGTVQIRVNGTTHVMGRAPCLQPHSGITHKQLLHVLHLADTDGFFSLPPRITSTQKNVDLAWLSVSIYTTTGTKTVQEAPGGVNASFDRVYRALKHLAPFAFACPSPQSPAVLSPL